MAYPALIQKIFDLRRSHNEALAENARVCAAIARLCESDIRLSDRMARLELMHVFGCDGQNCIAVPEAVLNPAGHELVCGAKVAPVTLVEKGHEPHPGAALSIVLDGDGKNN